MTEFHSAGQASERIRTAMERLRKDVPQLAAIFDAFEPLLVEQAALKADLPSPNKEGLRLDPAPFAQGVPILAKNDFVLSDDLLKEAAERLTPALEKGFLRLLTGKFGRIRRKSQVAVAASVNFFASPYWSLFSPLLSFHCFYSP